jgi:hypothetical protein
MTNATDQERTEAIEELRAMFPVGSTVSTILRHTSKSGMSRAISVVGPHLGDVSYLVAKAGVAKLDSRHVGLKMGGCGMDMGFALVYGLSRTLYADGFKCIGKGCPSNDHSNDYGFESRAWREAHPGEHFSSDVFNATEARRYSKSRKHSDGGYALSHRWL